MISKESAEAILKESVLTTFAKIALADNTETSNVNTTDAIGQLKQTDVIHALKLGYSEEELRSVPSSRYFYQSRIHRRTEIKG